MKSTLYFYRKRFTGHDITQLSEAEAEIENLQARIEMLSKDQVQHQVTKLKLNQAESRAERLEGLVAEYQAKLEAIAQPEPQTRSPDPGTILHRLRKKRRKSKADLKDVELIVELLGAIALTDLSVEG